MAQLIVQNVDGCRDTATNTIRVNGLPTAAFNISLACLAHPTLFFDHSDPYLAPLVYSGWNITNNGRLLGSMTGFQAAFTFDSLGSYHIIHAVADTNSCIDTVTRLLTVVPSPTSAFSITPNYNNLQGQIKLQNGSLGASEYYWELGNGLTTNAVSPVTTYEEDGTYLIQLFARNTYDCVDSTSMLFTMLYKGLWVPNALAMGPVQSVKIWKPVGVNLASYSVKIFDRWNVLIWKSDKLTDKGAPAEGWDGTFNGLPCPQGVYVWKITAIYSDGEIWRNQDYGNHDNMTGGNSGYIHLIR